MRSANLPDSPSVTSSSPAERSHGSNDTARATPSSQRLHHLDAVRAGALLLGIVLHSLLPFEPGGMWLFTDSRSAEWTSETVFTSGRDRRQGQQGATAGQTGRRGHRGPMRGRRRGGGAEHAGGDARCQRHEWGPSGQLRRRHGRAYGVAEHGWGCARSSIRGPEHWRSEERRVGKGWRYGG